MTTLSDGRKNGECVPFLELVFEADQNTSEMRVLFSLHCLEYKFSKCGIIKGFLVILDVLWLIFINLSDAYWLIMIIFDGLILDCDILSGALNASVQSAIKHLILNLTLICTVS